MIYMAGPVFDGWFWTYVFFIVVFGPIILISSLLIWLTAKYLLHKSIDLLFLRIFAVIAFITILGWYIFTHFISPEF